MANSFRINDLAARESFPRALQFVLNEIAKTAVPTFRRDIGTIIDRPGEWTSNGLRYRRV